MIAVLLAALLAITSVPGGDCVMVNGLIGEGEWDESATIELDPTVRMRVHKDSANLFMAIEFLGARHTGIDLYLESGGKTRMLHVSSAIGEKTLEDGQWSDYSWGENVWWTANLVGSIFVDGNNRFLEPEAFEFQIDRRELGSEVSLFIRLKRPAKTLPPGASEDTHDKWLRLKLK